MQYVTHVAVDVHRLVDVRLPELEVGVALERAHVGRRTGDEVVESEHTVAMSEQRLAEVRADEAGSAGDDGARLRARAIRGRNPRT